MIVEMSDVREALGVQSAREETRLQSVLAGVVADFKARTYRVWDYTVGYTELWRPRRGQRILWPKLYPWTALTIHEWGTNETDADAEELDAENYAEYPEDGEIARVFTPSGIDILRVAADASGYDWWNTVVRATITGGYTNATFRAQLPDAYEAILTQIRFKLQRSQGTNVAVNSTSSRDSSTTFIEGPTHPDYAAVVKRYRRIT